VNPADTATALPVLLPDLCGREDYELLSASRL
jgi:hypothetical protein